MKIAFFTNIPSPYRVAFFNELGKYCDLTVFFEKSSSDERDSQWGSYDFRNFKGVFLKGIKTGVDKAISFEFRKYLAAESFDHIIISNAGTPTGVFTLLYLKGKKIPYWIEGDGGFAKSGKGVKERFKKFILSGAKGYFSTSKKHDQYYIQYGADPKKIVRYPFTALLEKDVLPVPPTNEEKAQFKKALGIQEKQCVITVGRFIHIKGFDLLLQAARNIPQTVGMYFVGGTPTEEYLQLKETYRLENVHFVSFLSKDVLKKWYMAADVFVLPTRGDVWGLVVNEAMGAGLPVVTTQRCIAGLELVKNGENGFLVPTEDVDALAEHINRILCDQEQQHRMAQNCLKTIQQYTIEKMAQRHIEIFRDMYGFSGEER